MLSLDSARWGELAQAYGAAEDVPRLLAHLDRVGDAERAELWLGLWATLCGRGAVYTASYAALPHLVAFAGRCPSVAERARALHLVGTIEVARHAPGAPPLPHDLAAEYEHALAAVPAAIARAASESWDADAAQIFAGVLAVAMGQPRVGNAVLRLDPVVVCPVCGSPHAPAGWGLDIES